MAAPTLGYTGSVFVPLPTNDELSLLRTLALKADHNLNVSRMIAGTDDMMVGAVAMVRAVFDAKGIPAQLRELIILRSAVLLNCPYEWQQNVQMAENAGCTQLQIDAVASGGSVDGLGDEVNLVMSATDELTKSGTLSDGVLQQLLDRYQPTLTRKIILTISWFNLLSRFLNGCRVPMETEDKIGNKTSPL